MQQLPPDWDADQDELLTCVAVRTETHDVSTFVFSAAEPRLFRFLPGQFMTFDLPAAGPDGTPMQRSYTIASPPTRPWRIEVTAKRSPGGAGSGWLHDAMRPGVQIRASGPMGDFVLDPDASEPRSLRQYLFLSAGSGVTPLMSMARTLHDLGSDADVLFLHSARSPADLLFREELAVMARRPGFRAVNIVETDAPGARWDGLRGRLSPAMLGLLVPDLQQRDVFCCGPAPYMAAIRTILDAAGFDRARYREESFSFGTALADAPVTAATPATLQPGMRAPSLSPAAKPALLFPATSAAVPLLAADATWALPAGNLPLPLPAGKTAALAPHVSPGGMPPGKPDVANGPASSGASDSPPLPLSPIMAKIFPPSPNEASIGAAAPSHDDQRIFTIHFARLGRDIACPGGTNVLTAARAAGVRLPSACGKGVCGTCKSRVLSGTVEMRHGGGIRQREVADGLALLCCARPTSDLVLDR